MNAMLIDHRADIAALCRQFEVRKLDVFGSAARGDDEVTRSDIDVVAEFEAAPLGTAFDRYIGFKQGLEALFHRPVDVVELHAVRNRRLRQHIERSRVPLYALA